MFTGKADLGELLSSRLKFHPRGEGRGSLFSISILIKSFLDKRLVMAGEHLVFLGRAEVEFSLLHIRPCRRQHRLRQTHGLEEGNGFGDKS
jgi:hypothetical protein